MTKKRLGLFLLALTMLVFCFAGTVSAAAPEEYADARDAAAAIADTLIAAGLVTGIQYAMIIDGEIVVSEKAGVYSLVEERELTTDDLFGAGSVSKMFTAAAAMKLVEDGKLDLSKPVTEYLPDFKMADPRYEKITVRMLLNHSSGLSGSTLGNAFLFGDNDQSATTTLMSKLESQKLRFDPGAFSVYCNDGFTLAQILVERVSGQSFTQYLRESFFIPLGMDKTRTSADDFDFSDLADAYPYGTVTLRELANVVGTGGVYTTAEDLCRFSLALTGEEILSKDSATQMMAKEYLNGLWPKDAEDNTIGYGIGWDCVNLYPYNHYGITALTKGGDTPAYHAALVALPEYGLAAAVLSSGGTSAINTYLANALLEGALLENGVIDEKFPGKSLDTTVQAMPAEMKEYSGFYGSFMQVVKIEITDEGKMLVSSPEIPDMPAEEYFYTGDGGFTDEIGQVRISFVKEGAMTYVRFDAYANAPEIGAVTAIAQYNLQKLEGGELDSETAAAWAEREGLLYFITNEKYSSIAYMSLPAIVIGQLPELPGYISAMRIEDADNAISVIQIPGMAGRDLRDLAFFTDDGIEYALYSDYKAICITGVPFIYSGPKSICTIQSGGEARWYQVDPALAGKTISVDAPAGASFYIYDAGTGVCVMNSYAFGMNEAEVPENAIIAFAGEAGAQFAITIS